jgi:pimeloyl-ACP methyl ester carboxylesterase
VDRALIDNVVLEYKDCGAGEPVVCIHGAFIADAFRPLLSERRLADRYRLISYRRRGYGGSSRAEGPTSLSEQARDCQRLLSQLGVERTHVVGHSFGGTIAIQLALDAPQLVHTLSLLEPGLMVGESAKLYRQGLESGLQRFQDAGARVAIDEFLQMRWPEYHESLEHALPGAFEQAVADGATWFETDLPAVLDSQFGEAEARTIVQPVLVVLGERSTLLHPRFAETHRLLLNWLPNAEGFVVAGAAHFQPVESPRRLAEALADFYARHPS